MRKAVIILPTFNEAGSIDKLIRGIFESTKSVTNWEINVLVVDSKSTDETGSIVMKLIKSYPKLHLLKVEKEGLGKAYIQGFKTALEKLTPYLIFEMDADMSHDPKEIPVFLAAVEQGSDFVIGSRYIKGGSIPENWAFRRKLYSIGANLVIRWGFMKQNITDWTSGYRAIKAWIVKSAIDHIKNYSGYVFQVAFLDYAVKNNARISEIPINFKDRKSGKSKINSFQYIVQTFLYVFLHSTFIRYVIVGFIGFGVDFGVSYLFIDVWHKTLWLGTLVSTESAIISNFILNNYWSFAHKRLEHKGPVLALNFLKFNLVSSGGILIQTIGITILASVFGRNLWVVYKVLIITLIIIPYSYFMYNKFIWKDKR